MCRHLAYLGEPTTLAKLVLDPEHSLQRQAWAPRDMRGSGTINADGFGVGWYQTAGTPPTRYRSIMPIWGDAAFASLAQTITSGAVLAAVRSATPTMPIVETACAPFTEGPWLFSHNGVVPGWPEAVLDLAQRLPVLDLITLDAPTDSALIWALLRDRLRARIDPVTAVTATVAEIHNTISVARLNLLLTNGETIVATTYGHSLWARPGAVASEPYDSTADWEPIADHQIVTVTPSRITVEAL